MTVLALCPSHNRPGVNGATGLPWRDATGAFQPEAEAFAALHGGTCVQFDSRVGEPARFQEALRTLRGFKGANLKAVGLFMHGFRTGLQCGARSHNVATFAAALRAVLAPSGVVALYACDAARDTDSDRRDDVAKGPGGAGGFASRLARAGLQTDAHASAAHTTKNPYLRRFLPGDDTDDGVWIVAPNEGKLWKAWRKALADEDPTFRLSFPLRSRDEIRASLG